jgi:hypothetical protein
MPSVSLVSWQNDRLPRLAVIDTHCAGAAILVPPNLYLAEESLRSYVMLLSGHFQGYCRDLYTECSQFVASSVTAGLAPTIQAQFSRELKLNSNNPTVETIKRDFERFAFTLDFAADPANGLRVTHLGHLNKWRNTIAHQKVGVPTGVPPLTLAAVQSWQTACDGLATWLDDIMRGELLRILGVPPW